MGAILTAAALAAIAWLANRKPKKKRKRKGKK